MDQTTKLPRLIAESEVWPSVRLPSNTLNALVFQLKTYRFCSEDFHRFFLSLVDLVRPLMCLYCTDLLRSPQRYPITFRVENLTFTFIDYLGMNKLEFLPTFNVILPTKRGPVYNMTWSFHEVLHGLLNASQHISTSLNKMWLVSGALQNIFYEFWFLHTGAGFLRGSGQTQLITCGSDSGAPRPRRGALTRGRGRAEFPWCLWRNGVHQ